MQKQIPEQMRDDTGRDDPGDRSFCEKGKQIWTSAWQ